MLLMIAEKQTIFWVTSAFDNISGILLIDLTDATDCLSTLPPSVGFDTECNDMFGYAVGLGTDHGNTNTC